MIAEKIICPKCKKEVYMTRQTRGECFYCFSSVSLDNEKKPYTIKSTIRFNCENFVIGLFINGVFIGLFVYLYFYLDVGLVLIGLQNLLAPVLVYSERVLL